MPKTTSIYENFNLPIVELTNNKLIVTTKVLNVLNILFGDRVAINYYQISREETFPVIGKSGIFTDPTGGNALSKSNTISFRGNQRTVLLEYGNLFKLEPFKAGMFKLVPIINDDNIEQEQKELDNLNMIGDEIADEFDDPPFI
jgi:hypothetical protein